MKTTTKLNLVTLLLICSFIFAKAQVPLTSPPDLGYDAEDVLSFFSEKYGEAFPSMSSPSWGQSSTWDYTATADDQGVLILNNLNWLPIALNGTAQLKSYSYVHVDVFCNEETDFRVGFHRHYPDTKEQYFPTIEKGIMKPGKWYSIDYPLNDFFENGWESYDAHYLRFGGELGLGDYKPEWSKEIYVTNFILFNGEPTCLGGKVIGDPESGLPYLRNDYSLSVYVSNDFLNCSASELIKQINIYNISGQLVNSVKVDDVTVIDDFSFAPMGIYVVSAEMMNGEIVSKRFVK